MINHCFWVCHTLAKFESLNLLSLFVSLYCAGNRVILGSLLRRIRALVPLVAITHHQNALAPIGSNAWLSGLALCPGNFLKPLSYASYASYTSYFAIAWREAQCLAM